MALLVFVGFERYVAWVIQSFATKTSFKSTLSETPLHDAHRLVYGGHKEADKWTLYFVCDHYYSIAVAKQTELRCYVYEFIRDDTNHVFTS